MTVPEGCGPCSLRCPPGRAGSLSFFTHPVAALAAQPTSSPAALLCISSWLLLSELREGNLSGKVRANY